MGYMRHHGIFITTYSEELAKEAHAHATTIYDLSPFLDDFSSLVTPLQESAINGYWSFAILPDGSKEGWEDSDTGDSYRDALKAWLRSKSYEDGSSPFSWVEVQYGDDDGVNYIKDSSDQEKPTVLAEL